MTAELLWLMVAADPAVGDGKQMPMFRKAPKLAVTKDEGSKLEATCVETAKSLMTGSLNKTVANFPKTAWIPQRCRCLSYTHRALSVPQRRLLSAK